MGKKILIIGGVAGGASAAARLRRLSEEDEIIMFERGPHVSYSNCSIPYHLSCSRSRKFSSYESGDFLKTIQY